MIRNFLIILNKNLIFQNQIFLWVVYISSEFWLIQSNFSLRVEKNREMFLSEQSYFCLSRVKIEKNVVGKKKSAIKRAAAG